MTKQVKKVFILADLSNLLDTHNRFRKGGTEVLGCAPSTASESAIAKAVRRLQQQYARRLASFLHYQQIALEKQNDLAAAIAAVKNTNNLNKNDDERK